MANRLVSVDDNLHLPPAVRNQLAADFTDDMVVYRNAAQTAASTASGAAAAASTARDEAVEAAFNATAPVDAVTANFIEDTGSDTRQALDTLYQPVAQYTPTMERSASNIPGAAVAHKRILGVYPATWMTTADESGFMPDAAGAYNALWTRDHAYVLWHMPNVVTPLEIERFVRNRIATRTTSATVDPDGGTFGAAGDNFVADRIAANGTPVFKNAGMSKLPFMDGIAFTILSLWVHWKRTNSTALFEELKADIDVCLASLPRSSSGCVYSDPLAPSIDYGFTDTIKKTGDVTYGTALLAWAYKMMAEMNGEKWWEGGTYTTLRNVAQDGLATLRKPSGWYAGSSGNNAAVDDVWATALIAAEGLCTPQEARDSGVVLRDAFLDGTITSRGWVRHLPSPQVWSGTVTPVNTYQNGAYWLTPLWDCYRAVYAVDPTTAFAWASQAVAETNRQHESGLGAANTPVEWFHGATNSTPKGYVASAAILARFSTPSAPSVAVVHSAATGFDVDLSTNPGWELTNFTYNATTRRLESSGTVDGDRAISPTGTTWANVAIAADMTFTGSGVVFPGLIVRYVDANNYIFASVGGATNHQVIIYHRIGGTITALGTVNIGTMVAGQTARLVLSAFGTTVQARCKNASVTGTTTLTTAGRVGLRHGRSAAGTSTYRNITVGTNLDAAITSQLTATTVPAGMLLVTDGSPVGPGASANVPLSGDYRLIDQTGNPIAISRQTAGHVLISAPLDD